MESLVIWYQNSLGSFMPKEVFIFLVSMLPLIELRGGLIIASLLKVPLMQANIICILGNILPDRLMSALSVAIYGMFVAVVVPEMKKARPVLIVVIIAIILSCLFYYIPLLSKISSGITITIVAITAAIIGSIFFPVSDEADNSNN